MSHNDLATQASTLGDRSHQKRELAAISVEMTVRQIMSNDISGPGGIHGHHHGLSPMGSVLNQNRSAAEIIYRRTDQIQKVINFLMTNYIDSEQGNYRKGGLLGLAGVIMALTTKRNTLTYEGITFLNQVIPIIQKCLDDKDASVRYYANETLFNVIKVARYHMILFFDLIFNQIQILCDDEDELVRESNKCVNRLLQDVACNYDHFKIKPFINILQQLIRSKSIRVRILALDWIIALDAEPDIYFLVYLHHFLNPLFALIIDHRTHHHHRYNNNNNRYNRHRKVPKDTQLTQQIMTDFLAEISEYLQRDPSDIHPSEKFDINRIVVNLVEIIMSDNNQLQIMLNNDMYRNGNNENERRKQKKNNTQFPINTNSNIGQETTEGNQEEVDMNDHHHQNEIDDDSGSDLQIEAILDYKHKSKGGGGTTNDLIDSGEDTTDSLNKTMNSNMNGTRNRGYSVGSNYNVASQEVGNARQKEVALEWLDIFITLGGHRLKKLYPRILQSILFAMNDKRLQSTASLLNEHLMELVLNLDEMEDDDHNNNMMEGKKSSSPPIIDKQQQEERDNIDDIINELKEENGVNCDELGDDEILFNNKDNKNDMMIIKSKYDSFDIKSVMEILIDVLQNSECAIHSRIAALKWISSLLVDLPFNHIPNDKLLSVCFMRLCDADNVDDESIRILQNTVTNMTLEVLARLSLHPKIFEQLLTNLLQLFYKKPSVLSNKGKLIITKLCSLLNCTKIYSLLSELILKEYSSDYDQSKRIFVRNIVRLLNIILLTTKELYPLREIIKKSYIENNIFLVLYKTWCCSPIPLVSLCLLAQRYDLGLMLIDQFKKDIFVHKSVQFLLEIDELIHLLESPIFLHLRLQLLCIDDSNIDDDINPKWTQLFEIVNGLLTLLPNSDGFHQFRIRIQMISLYKRLFYKLAIKSNNHSLVNDKILHHAMYYHRYNNLKLNKLNQKKNHLQCPEKDELFKQYLDTQTAMHTVL